MVRCTSRRSSLCRLLHSLLPAAYFHNIPFRTMFARPRPDCRKARDAHEAH